ncbi:C-C motif chemokine 13-like [Colossoma macropomum]|uniref:C-C motif chemokine 13-like n=1 Tax=Colossoma macropomum TaxID=42526 RepID=UPI001864FA4B|nr:C-C motif chemokine 13-like [Colossoma macropomum]
MRSAGHSSSTGLLPPLLSSVSLGEISSARMRTLSALLMVLLLCSLQQMVYCGTEALGSENDCCQKPTVLRKLPLARIESYSLTSSKCPINAVVFQMVTGKIFCVDPSWDWVKSHMKAVDQKKASTASKL